MTPQRPVSKPLDTAAPSPIIDVPTKNIVGTFPAPQFSPSPKRYHADGLRFTRYFTKAGVDPYAVVNYERRSSVIRETDGREIFRMDDVEVPSSWSQVATDILAYFSTKILPQNRRPAVQQ